MAWYVKYSERPLNIGNLKFLGWQMGNIHSPKHSSFFKASICWLSFSRSKVRFSFLPSINLFISYFSYVDAQKMGSFKKGGFSSSRSPDPIDENIEFIKNILSRINSNAFSSPIAECMLDQNFFNGT